MLPKAGSPLGNRLWPVLVLQLLARGVSAEGIVQGIRS